MATKLSFTHSTLSGDTSVSVLSTTQHLPIKNILQSNMLTSCFRSPGEHHHLPIYTDSLGSMPLKAAVLLRRHLPHSWKEKPLWFGGGVVQIYRGHGRTCNMSLAVFPLGDVAPAGRLFDVPWYPVILWQMVVPGLKQDAPTLSAHALSGLFPPQAQQMYLTLEGGVSQI